MIHGHEVLKMMFGNSYSSKEALIQAIIEKFGNEARFYTCSTENMTAEDLVRFLEEHGKFMQTRGGCFTADESKMCKD